MRTYRGDLAAAIRCCRNGMCEQCPLQTEYCDELIVETADVPVELLERIEEELENK